MRFVPMTMAVGLIGLSLPAAAQNEQSQVAWPEAVGQALGRVGTEQPGGVYRFGFPRSDLSVTLDGVAIKPGFALGSWVAVEPMGDEVMVMGDLVLTQGSRMRSLR